MATGDNNNGETRVTLAVLKRDIEEIRGMLREFIGEQRRMNDQFSERLHTDEVDASKRETRLAAVEADTKENCENIDRLRESDRRFGIIGVIAGAVAGVLTGWFKP